MLDYAASFQPPNSSTSHAVKVRAVCLSRGVPYCIDEPAGKPRDSWGSLKVNPAVIMTSVTCWVLFMWVS